MTKYADLIAELRRAPEGNMALDQWVGTIFGYRQAVDGSQWQHPVTKLWAPDLPAFTQSMDAAMTLLWPYAQYNLHQALTPEGQMAYSMTIDGPYIDPAVKAATLPLVVCLGAILIYHIVQQHANELNEGTQS